MITLSSFCKKNNSKLFCFARESYIRRTRLGPAGIPGLAGPRVHKYQTHCAIQLSRFLLWWATVIFDKFYEINISLHRYFICLNECQKWGLPGVRVACCSDLLLIDITIKLSLYSWWNFLTELELEHYYMESILILRLVFRIVWRLYIPS